MTTTEQIAQDEREAADWLDDRAAAQRLVDLSTELVGADERIEAMKRALAAMQEQRVAIVTRRDTLKEHMATRGIADGTRIRVVGGQVRFVPAYARASKTGDVGQIIPATIRVDLARTFSLAVPSAKVAPTSGVVAKFDAAPITQPSAKVA